ncbi:hypothetical protein D9758_011052 [Tetrapyrgos nigripes]|uniref:DH domain-containing protein n=1 Tax=Tetrapyrgos nigripes TaxID=182062 RepID=A0A8H5FS81_9AGAR|nr:hypothetical protein D9758_011052 [Tetrapyrgos nigripes]
MPLSRSNTTSRSRSRSPAPTTPILSSTQSPRPFLPPSHYAAAGGIPLPDRNKSSERVNRSMSMSNGFSCQDGYSPSSFLAPELDSLDGRTPTDSPVPLETARSPSVSSMKRRQSQYSNLPLVEAQLLPSLRDTIDRMTRTPSQAACMSPVPAPTTPTLRISHDDYIDTSNPYSSTRPRTPLMPDNLGEGHGGERPYTPKVPSVRSTPKSALKSALRTPSASKASSLKSEEPQVNNANTSSHSPGVGSTLRSVKSLLRRKSSSSSVATASVSEKEKQSSKENYKPFEYSFSSLKSSTPAPIPSSTHVYPSMTIPAPGFGFGTRSRSCTDPGTGTLATQDRDRDSTFRPQLKPNYRMPITPQPSNDIPSTFHSTSNREKQNHNHSQTTSKSNIPRFHVSHRGKVGATAMATAVAGGSAGSRPLLIDDSDMEYRYEVDSRDRRKLMVMNAEVVPSSSCSEGDVDGEIDAGTGTEGEGEGEEDSVVFSGFSDDLQSNSSLDMRSVRKLGLIGLGLGLRHGNRNVGHGRYDSDSQVREGQEERGEIMESENNCEDDFDANGAAEERTLKTPRDHKDFRASMRTSVYSMASYQSEGSVYTEDDDEVDVGSGFDRGDDFSEDDNEGYVYRQDSNQDLQAQEESETKRRRRTALLGLVDGLQMASNPSRRQSLGQSDVEVSDYCGEDGVAVSLSNETGFEGLDMKYDGDPEQHNAGEDFTWAGRGAQRQVTKPLGMDSRDRARRTNTPSEERRVPIVPKNTPSKESNRRATTVYKPSGGVSGNGSGSGFKIPSASLVGSRIPSPSPRIIATSSEDRNRDREKRSRASHIARSPRTPHVPSLPPALSPTVHDSHNDHRKSLTTHVHQPDRDRDQFTDLTRAASPPCNPPSNTTASSRDSFNAFEAVMIAKKSREAAARNLKAWGIPPSESDQIHLHEARGDVNARGRMDDNASTSVHCNGDVKGSNGECNGSGEIDDCEDGMRRTGPLPTASSVASSVDNLKGSCGQVNDAVEEELSHGAERLFRTLSGRERGRQRQRSGDKEKERNHGHGGQSGQAVSGTRAGSRSATPMSTAKSAKSASLKRKTELKAGESQREANASRSQSCPRPQAADTATWLPERPLTPCEQIVAKYNTKQSADGVNKGSEAGQSQPTRLDVITEIYDSENTFVNRVLSVVDLFILPLRVQDTKVWISGVPLEIAKMLDWFEDIVNLHVELRQTVYGIKVNLASAANATMELVANPLRVFVKKLEVYQPYLVKIGKTKDMLDRLARDVTSDFGEFVRIQEDGDGDRSDDRTLVKLLMEPMERLGEYHGMFKRLLDATPKTHQDYLTTFTLVCSTGLVIKTLNEVKKREEEYEFVKTLSERIDGLPISAQLARRERRLLCQGSLLQEERLQTQREDSTAKSPASKISRMSGLVNAIQEGRGRSGSTSSASTGTSFRSVETMASPPPVSLQVLVFSDLVVFAATRARRENQEQGTERWSLCPDTGICRIVDVVEVSSSDAGSSITLDVVPVGSEHSQPTPTESSTVKTLCLRIPEPQPSSLSPNIPSRELWINSFKRSLQSTLRSLSDPRFSQEFLIDGPNRLLEHDRRRILNSILTSGLPFPKSPSLQEASVRMGEGDYDYDPSGDPTTKLEREERGWWSLRFKQVLYELLHENWPNSFEVLVPGF